MTVQTTAHPAASGVRLAPLLVVLIAIIAFATGMGVASLGSPIAAVAGPGAAPGASFDAVQFRAEERASWVAAPTFDAVQFRAEERQP